MHQHALDVQPEHSKLVWQRLQDFLIITTHNFVKKYKDDDWFYCHGVSQHVGCDYWVTLNFCDKCRVFPETLSVTSTRTS